MLDEVRVLLEILEGLECFLHVKFSVDVFLLQDELAVEPEDLLKNVL